MDSPLSKLLKDSHSMKNSGCHDSRKGKPLKCCKKIIGPILELGTNVPKKKLFVAFPWVETSTGPGGFMICVFII